MDTKDLIIGAIIGGALIWLWTRQQSQNQLNQLNQLRNYQNDETIVVTRDKEGFISELKVKRDAYVNR